MTTMYFPNRRPIKQSEEHDLENQHSHVVNNSFLNLHKTYFRFNEIILLNLIKILVCSMFYAYL